MRGKSVLYSAVQTEVVTLAEAKLAIKLDSTDFQDNIAVYTPVAAGYHAITATATGSAISSGGKKTLFLLEPASLSAFATLDVKLQESLDGVTYSDVASGAFTQVTTANDTVLQEKEYTGTYNYIRPVYSIVSAQASFSVKCIQSDATSIEDSYVQDLIAAAREYAEEYTTRAIGTQAWKLILDDFPGQDYISLPFAPLQSVTSVKYILSDGTSATLTASESTGYIVDTTKEPGGVFMAYGLSWPAITPYPYNGVEILYYCGYTSTTVPKKIKDAVLKMVGALYNHRQDGIPDQDLKAIQNLLRGARLIDFGQC
jgi:uncharacterized phiE125 gp8 family phage protein